jgi:hypothetical protein
MENLYVHIGYALKEGFVSWNVDVLLFTGSGRLHYGGSAFGG